MSEAADPELDPALFREVMGHYPTGVTVVTGFDGAEPVGMVVGTFTSVSLDPPLVAFMPTRASSTYARLESSPAFCINVLAQDQLDVCRVLAGRDSDKFDRVKWDRSPLGAPQIADAVAYIDCVTERVLEAGDHWIVLCRVKGVRISRPVTPLLFFQGGYGGFTPRAMAAQGDAELISALRLAEVARGPVERLAETLRCEACAIVLIGPDFVTTAVSSYGGSSSMVEPLGQRLPLMPPIGEAWVAAAKPEVTQRWLSKAVPQDAKVVDMYRKRLAKVAERGASISYITPDRREDYDRLQTALVDYANGDPTPARERALHETLTKLSVFWDSVDIEPENVYNIASIVVPVRDPSGDLVIGLRIRQLPEGASGTTVQAWIDSVKDAAAQVERELRGDNASADLEDYLAWYESDFPA